LIGGEVLDLNLDGSCDIFIDEKVIVTGGGPLIRFKDAVFAKHKVLVHPSLSLLLIRYLPQKFVVRSTIVKPVLRRESVPSSRHGTTGVHVNEYTMPS